MAHDDPHSYPPIDSPVDQPQVEPAITQRSPADNPQPAQPDQQDHRDMWPNRVVALATAILVVVTALYTHYARQQAILMRAAVEATREATRVTQDALALTREQFRIDQRPYVGTISRPQGVLTSNLPFFSPDNNGSISWNWYFSNLGKSPALNVRFSHYVEIGASIDEVATKKEQRLIFRRGRKPESSEVTGAGSAMLPGDKSWATANSLEGIELREFNRLRTADGGITLHGRITYSDLSGANYETTFCQGLLSNGAVMNCDEADAVK